MWGYKPASVCSLPPLPSVSSAQRNTMDRFNNNKTNPLLSLTKMLSDSLTPFKVDTDRQAKYRAVGLERLIIKSVDAAVLFPLFLTCEGFSTEKLIPFHHMRHVLARKVNPY